MNLEFLDGTRGAHVSISGISGVATKTSFALFLLHTLFTSGALGARRLNAKALIFSVKGEDLLFLDQPNIRLDDDLRAQYARLGLRGQAVRARSGSSPRRPRATRPGARTSPAGPPASTRSGGRWPSSARRSCCRTCSPTSRTNATSTRWSSTRSRPAGQGRRPGRQRRRGLDRRHARSHLARAGRPHRRQGHRRRHPGGVGRPGHRHGHDQRVHPPAAFLGPGPAPIIRGDLHRDLEPARIDTADQQVTVVDLHNLHERAQRFVVGVVLAARDRAQGSARAPADCCSR